jgi:hypothetical protein
MVAVAAAHDLASSKTIASKTWSAPFGGNGLA